MKIRVLGPLEVEVDDTRVAVGGPRIRRLLTVLTLASGSVRSVDVLTESVWSGETPPPQARRTLMSYVSRLRGILPRAMIEQVGSGYRLCPDDIWIDCDAFASDVVRSRRSLREGDPAGSVAGLDDALALWRGEPLAEFRGDHWADPERLRLGELRMVAMEGRFEAKLILGHVAEVFADVERQATTQPDRHHLQYLYILALYQSGRQVEALRRFQAIRQQLVELGLRPSLELRGLEYQILTQDERLLAVPAPWAAEPFTRASPTVPGHNSN